MEVDERDHVIGASSPTLTLVEYGDFACRFCFAAHRPVMSLLDRFDELRLVWRHLPDPELHPGADLAAELSELAAAHDMESGQQAGVHGTPTFFLDGERLEGPWRQLGQVVPARLRGR